MAETSSSPVTAPPLTVGTRVAGLLLSAVLHAAVFACAFALAGVVSHHRDASAVGPGFFVYLVTVLAAPLLFVVSTASLARHWLRQRRPELVVLEALSLAVGLMGILALIAISSIK